MAYINPNAQSPAPNAIYAMMQLLEVRKAQAEKDGTRKDIALAAGLPDHDVPEEVRARMEEVANFIKTNYPKYDDQSKFRDEVLLPLLALYHEANFGVKIDPKDIFISPGSTPVLELLSHVVSKPGEAWKGLVVYPSYPLEELGVRRFGGTVDKTARMEVKIDLDEHDDPYKPGRWKLDLDSLRKALEKNRDTATILYINEPGNPTGFMPTEEEQKARVEILLDDIRERKQLGIATIGVLEDMAYATMTHHGKKYYSLHNAIQDLESTARESGDTEKLDLLKTLREDIVVSHSLSKAGPVAGFRVAYGIGEGKLGDALAATLTEVLLTNSVTTLAALTGFLASKGIDTGIDSLDKIIPKKDGNAFAVEEYGERLRMIERGLNEVFGNWMASKQIAAPAEGDKSFVKMVRQHMPVQAESDAGFFATMDVTRLFMDRKEDQSNGFVGIKVDEAIIDKIRRQVAEIPRDDVRGALEGIFKNGRISNAVEAALYLLEITGVAVVPISKQNAEDQNIRLRISVGKTDKDIIKEVLERMRSGLENNLEPPQYGRSAA